MTAGIIAPLYAKIGSAGVALIFLSLASAYLSLKNLFLVSMIGRDFHRRLALIEQGDFYSSELRKSGNPIIGIIAEVVETRATRPDDIRSEVAYLFHRNFAHVNRDVTWLKLISVIAPLLGLLGTMFGMTTIFRQLAAGVGGANASLLADGIWVALLTTIMGMVIAIPTLVAFYWLSLKMKGLHIEAIEHSHRAVELLRRAGSAGAAGQSPGN
jgi:biopolymer transport protein ExbB